MLRLSLFCSRWPVGLGTVELRVVEKHKAS